MEGRNGCMRVEEIQFPSFSVETVDTGQEGSERDQRTMTMEEL